MACRVIYKLRKFDHVTDHQKALHWLKIRMGITYKIAMLVCKCKHNIGPKYLQELLISRQHMRALRSFNTDYMNPSICRNTEVINLSFSSAGPRIWNSLLTQIKNCIQSRILEESTQNTSLQITIWLHMISITFATSITTFMANIFEI